jgi:hypothetical protein
VILSDCQALTVGFRAVGFCASVFALIDFDPHRRSDKARPAGQRCPVELTLWRNAHWFAQHRGEQAQRFRRNHICYPRHQPETDAQYQSLVQTGWGIAMNTIVANVLMREAAEAQADARPLKLIALFCTVGLLASLCMASFGFDIGTGFF